MLTSLLAVALCMSEVSDSTVTLHDVMVVGQSQHDFLMRSSQSSVQVTRDYLDKNFAGSLMQTLQGIPGVKAMSIGSGQSKPMIRGLGFNRLAVTEDGIKHEGQQWGDDHGLEIDQFAIDRAEVIKGPAALLYGSDAIGGVVNLQTNHIPVRSFGGTVQMFGRSNNEQIGLSAKVGGRTGRFFYRANVTVIDYADYRVPTDSIQYYSYFIKLHKQRLRNTAGLERDGSVMLGYAGYNVHTDIRISDSYSKSGFFANAHGLEVRLSDIDYDKSRRDIDLPHQSVNHLKVLSHTSWTTDMMTAELNMAFQNNVRMERSEPISHGYMPAPDGSLERRFDKSTYTANTSLRCQLGDSHTMRIGTNTEYQHNRRQGWGFVIPDFEMFTAGVYAFDRYDVNERFSVNLGARYDYSRTRIHSYTDWFLTPVAGTDSVYKQRSADVKRNFNSVTWSVGTNYAVGQWVLKANVGKSFRVPIPKELGADGVNYHIFRYERGNSELDPEQSYQFDAGIHWSNSRMAVMIEPYVNFFPNYIYLNPTSSYVEGLQLYQYTQAEVLRYGMEAQVNYLINKHWKAEAKGEYLYARQQSGQKKGYTLPFSTPWTADLTLKYLFGTEGGDGFVSVNTHIVGTQNEIVPPEKPTDGHTTLNVSAGKHFDMGNNKLKIAFHADNILNCRYYDHTSYYRLIDVPEPGRNFSLMVGMEF